MVPPRSSRPKHKAAAAQALLPHQQVRLRVSEGSFNSLTPSIHDKETPAFPLVKQGKYGGSYSLHTCYVCALTLESLVYEKA